MSTPLLPSGIPSPSSALGFCTRLTPRGVAMTAAAGATATAAAESARTKANGTGNRDMRRLLSRHGARLDGPQSIRTVRVGDSAVCPLSETVRMHGLIALDDTGGGHT